MDLPERILSLLDKCGDSSVDSVRLSKELKEDYQKIVGAIKSLEALGDYVRTETETQKRWELTGMLIKIIFGLLFQDVMLLMNGLSK